MGSPLFQRTIKSGNMEFRVRGELDDEVLAQSEFSSDIIAEVRFLDPKTEHWSEWRSTKLTVKSSEDSNYLLISKDGKEIAEIPLYDGFPSDDNSDDVGIDVEAEDALLSEALLSEAAEFAIDGIPVSFAPITGCLVRSAASTVIGQTLRCFAKHPAERYDGFFSRAQDIRGCLREAGLKMSYTFVYRAGKCMAKLGF